MIAKRLANEKPGTNETIAFPETDWADNREQFSNKQKHSSNEEEQHTFVDEIADVSRRMEGN